jgi:uncharacterized membrane protein YjgN (DUF898 family)
MDPEQARKEARFPMETSSAAEEPDMSLEPEHLTLEFTGSAGEYFRIWIVNIFLTIVTLGIYAAWAKVRTRQYFYVQTMLADHPFAYTANPIAILKGNLIIAGGLILYALADFLNPTYTLVVILAFYLVIPFLIYKSLRFYARNSVYRNIRFRFVGTLGESYKTYLLVPLLIPLTLGIIFPYWAFRRKRYFFENFAFGTSRNTFDGQPGPFYKVYVLAGLLILALMVLAGIASSITNLAIFGGASAPGSPGTGISFVIMILVMYVVFLLVFTLVQQYVQARITNYCWAQSHVGWLRFESTLKARRLFWIRFTNIFAILFSLGLLIPWAKVRRTRYILDNIAVKTYRSLDAFAAAPDDDISAVGDTATDFFDLEIGL